MVPAAAFNNTELAPLKRMLYPDHTSIGYSYHNAQNYSLIQNKTVVIDEIELPSIALNVTFFEPTEECEEQSDFTWEFISYTVELGFVLKLIFNNPHCVSLSSNFGDTLQVTFNDQRLFRDFLGNYIEQKHTMQCNLPR